MRKPPVKKSRAVPASGKGQVKTSVIVRKGGKGPVAHQEDKTERVSIPISPGEEAVSVGYDIKYWASDQNHGMTVGSSAYVKVSCGPKEMDAANDVASELAYEYMHRNAKRIRRDIDKFIDGGE